MLWSETQHNRAMHPPRSPRSTCALPAHSPALRMELKLPPINWHALIERCPALAGAPLVWSGTYMNRTPWIICQEMPHPQVVGYLPRRCMCSCTPWCDGKGRSTKVGARRKQRSCKKRGDSLFTWRRLLEEDDAEHSTAVQRDRQLAAQDHIAAQHLHRPALLHAVDLHPAERWECVAAALPPTWVTTRAKESLLQDTLCFCLASWRHTSVRASRVAFDQEVEWNRGD